MDGFIHLHCKHHVERSADDDGWLEVYAKEYDNVISLQDFVEVHGSARG